MTCDRSWLFAQESYCFFFPVTRVTWLMAQADVTSRTSQQTLDLASAAGVCSCTVASAPSATNDTWPWR